MSKIKIKKEKNYYSSGVRRKKFPAAYQRTQEFRVLGKVEKRKEAKMSIGWWWILFVCVNFVFSDKIILVHTG